MFPKFRLRAACSFLRLSIPLSNLFFVLSSKNLKIPTPAKIPLR